MRPPSPPRTPPREEEERCSIQTRRREGSCQGENKFVAPPSKDAGGPDRVRVQHAAGGGELKKEAAESRTVQTKR